MHKFSGKIIKGDGYGRKLGFPTLNLDTRNDIGAPSGVYAGSVSLDGKEYQAAIVVNPTGKVEAHILNYNADIYGKDVILETKKFIRKYRDFNNERELINQISADIKLC
ncbi:MAG: riboflavin kinase [Candidatus Paceibacterota bacterium]|jgi:FAD synthase